MERKKNIFFLIPILYIIHCRNTPHQPTLKPGMSLLFFTLITSNSGKMHDHWHRGGFKGLGPSIAAIKSAIQKACRQLPKDDVDKANSCKYLALQCFVAASALIENMLLLKRVSDAKSLYTNMWNRLIIMSIDEDTVDINGALCLHEILKKTGYRCV